MCSISITKKHSKEKIHRINTYLLSTDKNVQVSKTKVRWSRAVDRIGKSLSHKESPFARPRPLVTK